MGFLEKAFAALPGVATSPLAFVAYLAAVIAWAGIAWRVNRNRQLLQHLDKLPEKARLEALRMEMGAVRLKSGLSPEQWIRSRIHLYTFLGFAILALIAVILFTVSAISAKGTVGLDLTLYQERPGGPAVAASSHGTGDVHLASLEVKNAYDGSGAKGVELDLGNYPPEMTLAYSYGHTEQGIQIRPEMPYLSLLARGGPVRDRMFSDSPFKWQFPKLSVKVVNNTNRTLLLTEVIVNVKRSEIDRNPVLVIPYGYDLTFQNEGWGRVKDPRVELGIAKAQACGTPALESAPRPFSLSLDSFADAVTIPVRLGEKVPRSYEGQEDVCAHGVMTFTTDAGEQKALKFQARVVIGEGGFGAAEEPSYFYDLLLEAGKQGYSKPVPISQSLRPGEADHFVVRIASDKSARFDLDLSLKDASGRVLPLQTVHLDLFVPRSQAGYAAARR